MRFRDFVPDVQQEKYLQDCDKYRVNHTIEFHGFDFSTRLTQIYEANL
jgi:hypothetical protein